MVKKVTVVSLFIFQSLAHLVTLFWIISSKQIIADWFDTGTLTQHSGSDGFGKCDPLSENPHSLHNF